MASGSVGTSTTITPDRPFVTLRADPSTLVSARLTVAATCKARSRTCLLYTSKVMLFERLRDHGRGPGERTTQVNSTTTDDTGAYDFDNLAAGEYLLAVSAEPWFAMHHSGGAARQKVGGDSSAALDVAYPVTFFDSVTDESSATRIVLSGGAREEANINLHAVSYTHLDVYKRQGCGTGYRSKFQSGA